MTGVNKKNKCVCGIWYGW